MAAAADNKSQGLNLTFPSRMELNVVAELLLNHIISTYKERSIENKDETNILTEEEHKLLYTFLHETLKMVLYKEKKMHLSEFSSFLSNDILQILSNGGLVQGKTIGSKQDLLHKALFCHREPFHETEELQSEFDCGSKVVKLLVEAGTDVNTRYLSDATPIHIAASHHCERNIEMLLKAGADVNLADDQGHFAINYFAQGIYDSEETRKEHLDLLLKRIHYSLDLLLEYGANINCKCNFWNTPLHYLLEGYLSVHTDVMKLFLSKGADVNIRNMFGSSPLHVAVKSSENDKERLNSIKYLLAQPSIKINEQDLGLKTPVMLAIQEDNSSILNLLISKGADLKIQDRNGATVLHFSILFAEISNVNCLIKECPNLLQINDYYGAGPIVYAVVSGDVDKMYLFKRDLVQGGTELLEFLLEVAKINEVDKSIDYLKMMSQSAPENNVELPWVKENVTHEYSEDANNIRLSELDNWLQYQEKQFQETNKLSCETALQNYLHLDVLREGENNRIFSEMTELIQRIANVVNHSNPLFSFTAELSGSNAEGTKIGMVDELDYLCYLGKITEVFDLNIIEVNTPENPTFLKLQCLQKVDNVKKHKSNPLVEYNKQLYLSSAKVGNEFFLSVCKAMANASVWKDLHFAWDSEAVGGSITTMKLFWTGHYYKYKEISLDLVPTLKFKNKMYHIENRQKIIQNLKIKTPIDDLIVVSKTLRAFKTNDKDLLWRISFSEIEKEIFCNVSKSAKKGYKLTKLIRKSSISPNIYFNEIYPLWDNPCGYLHSYALKTSLFHEIIHPSKNSAENLFFNTSNEDNA